MKTVTRNQRLKTKINEIIEIYSKNENGIISLGYALQSACQRSEVVKDYFKDEKKLTQEKAEKFKIYL